MPSENLRNATLEESLSREQVVEEIKSSLTSLTEERKHFTFDDDRKATPPGPRPPQDVDSQMDPPDTPVFPQDPVSITEATKKFFAGKTRSPYYGDLPRTSTLTQPEHRVQADNLVGHDSHAPLPPQELLAETDFPKGLAAEIDSGAALNLTDSSEPQTAD